jgi:hypothetical protein
MKKILALFLLLSLNVNAGIFRGTNDFTQADANIFSNFIVLGTVQLTNGFVKADITNGFVNITTLNLTNDAIKLWVNNQNYVTQTITNGLASQSWVNSQGFALSSITNGLLTAIATNGFVTSSITNGFLLITTAQDTYLPISGTNGLASILYANS